MGETLVQKFYGIVDGYYEPSDDFHLIKNILEEVEFLYSRGILREKYLGRFIDIIENGGRTKTDLT